MLPDTDTCSLEFELQLPVQGSLFLYVKAVIVQLPRSEPKTGNITFYVKQLFPDLYKSVSA